MTRAQATRRHRYEGIDLLRLCAALAVVLYHYAFRGAAAGNFTAFHVPSLAPVAQYGYLGVELFFIISGFVIALSAEGQSAATFARARFLRIFPAFLVAMTITATLALVIDRPRFVVSFTDWLANLTLFPQLFGHRFVDGVYWTLELEVIFYTWVALFIALGWFAQRRLLIIAAWLGLSVIVNALTSSEHLHALLLSDMASLFASGMLLYEIKQRGPAVGRILLLVGAIAMSVVGVLHRSSYVRDVLHARLDNGVLAAIVLVLYAVFIVSINLPRFSRFGRFVAFAGAVSYPLYLLHQHIGYMLFNLVGGSLSVLATVVLVSGTVVTGTVAFTLGVEPFARRVVSQLLNTVAASGRFVPSPRLSA